MEALSNRIPDTATSVALLQLQQQQQLDNLQPPYSREYGQLGDGNVLETASPSLSSSTLAENSQVSRLSSSTRYHFSGGSQNHEAFRPYSPNAKRKRGDFELTIECGQDLIGKGLISYEDAILYFACFFRGCVCSLTRKEICG